jgi:single-strand DNA-binding protein
MLAGNLTRDPQVRFFANERAVADFGLAINRRYKTNDGQMKEETTFVDVEAWGRTAELVGQYLTKGRSCYVEGRLKLDSWEDKEGQKRQKLKVVADSVQFLPDGRNQGGGDRGAPAEAGQDEGGAPGPATAAPARPAPAPADDEPPF